MRSSIQNCSMFIRNICGKFHRFLFIRFVVVLLVCTLVFNLYLFYNLRSVSYLQNTGNILQNGRDILQEEKKESTQLPQTPTKRACEVGNYSTFMSDLILQLKEDLDDSNLNAPNSTVLRAMSMQFLTNAQPVEGGGLVLTDDKIDFASKRLTVVLKESLVLKVENALKGSQLKLLVQLSNNITAIFKPRWYSPNDIVTGLVYSGKDRHYGEVVAFYLSILLNLRRVPPAVIRSFDIKKEIMAISDLQLLKTFLNKGNETCFFGVCHYCNAMDLLCTDTGRVEGALIYYLSAAFTLKIMPHPWRRTYRCSSVARWETDENYCTVIRNSKFYSNKKNKALFLDLIDVAIFDFLIDNGDRHGFEYAMNLKIPRLLILDNGKSFGNPYTDHIDILAPLYQCCRIRETMWSNLLLLRGGNLSKWLRFLLKQSDGHVELNELHYQALNRRLLLILTTVNYCFKKFGMQNVLVVA